MTMLDVERRWLEGLPRDNNSVLMREIVKCRDGAFQWATTTRNEKSREISVGAVERRMMEIGRGLLVSCRDESGKKTRGRFRMVFTARDVDKRTLGQALSYSREHRDIGIGSQCMHWSFSPTCTFHDEAIEQCKFHSEFRNPDLAPMRHWEREVNGPLILLYALAHYTRGHERLFLLDDLQMPIRELGGPLNKLLQEYGDVLRYNDATVVPTGDVILQLAKLEIWDVVAPGGPVKVPQSWGPSAYSQFLLKAAVRKADLYAGLSEEVFSQLSDEYITEVAIYLLETYFPASVHQRILLALGLRFSRPIPCSQAGLKVNVDPETQPPPQPPVWLMLDDARGREPRAVNDRPPVIRRCAEKIDWYYTSRKIATMLLVYQQADDYLVHVNLCRGQFDSRAEKTFEITVPLPQCGGDEEAMRAADKFEKAVRGDIRSGKLAFDDPATFIRAGWRDTTNVTW